MSQFCNTLQSFKNILLFVKYLWFGCYLSCISSKIENRTVWIINRVYIKTYKISNTYETIKIFEYITARNRTYMYLVKGKILKVYSPEKDVQNLWPTSTSHLNDLSKILQAIFKLNPTVTSIQLPVICLLGYHLPKDIKGAVYPL